MNGSSASSGTGLPTASELRLARRSSSNSRRMIAYALESLAWDPSTSVHYELDSIVVELLCFDQRWNALVQDENSAPLIFALRDLFAKAFQRWGKMPKVVNGFAGFAVLPGSRLLLLPGIPWVAAPAQEFSTYDWKYGLEENVTEYMRVAWQKEGQRIANDLSSGNPSYLS